MLCIVLVHVLYSKVVNNQSEADENSNYSEDDDNKNNSDDGSNNINDNSNNNNNYKKSKEATLATFLMLFVSSTVKIRILMIIGLFEQDYQKFEGPRSKLK